MLFALSPYTILEVIMIASHFVLGYGKSRVLSGVESRTWLDFSVLRSIFIYRSFVEMEKNFGRTTRGWMIFRLWAKSLLLIMFAAGVMFLLETLGELPYFVDNGFAHLYQCTDGECLHPIRRHCRDRHEVPER